MKKQLTMDIMVKVLIGINKKIGRKALFLHYSIHIIICQVIPVWWAKRERDVARYRSLHSNPLSGLILLRSVRNQNKPFQGFF